VRLRVQFAARLASRCALCFACPPCFGARERAFFARGAGFSGAEATRHSGGGDGRE